MNMDFGRGDGNYHTFYLPTSVWLAGGRLFFRAKQVFDDATNDDAAYIEGNWTDTSLIADATYKNVAYKRYNCYFPPSATFNTVSNGAASIDLLGEFQWVSPTGIPFTYPKFDEDKIPVTLYFDVDREVAA